MKSILFKSLAFCFIALTLWSCKKDETQTVATAGSAGTLTASVSALVLDKSMLSANVITFNMTDASFGYNAAITNVLEVAVKGTNFASPKLTALDTRATTKVFTGLDLNNLLLSLKLSTVTNTDVEFRIKSSIADSLAPVYSNVVSLSARPFPLTSWVYVPGNYQGWNPATADSLVSVMGDGVYTGYIKFDGGNFKITTGKNWNVGYGSAGAGKISTTGGDISSVSAGLKYVVVDLNANTISIEDAKVWSMIGNAIPGTNWDVDQDLNPVNDGKGTWTVTTNLSAGEFKFRYNHDWGISIGNGSGNVGVTSAGSYTVTLLVNADGKTGSYTLVKK